MRVRSFTLLLAGTASCLAMAQGPDGAGARTFDPYDPAALNEAAADAVRRGDASTAWILLERAARLAPHDARIAANLREVRAWRSGEAAPAAATVPAAAPAVRPLAAPRIPAEPPAIWPPR